LSQSIDTLYAELGEANDLTVAVRLGWLHSCINYVARLLSEFAQRELGISKALDLLRECIEAEHNEPQQIELALTELESKFEFAENQGYGPEAILMVHLALQAATGVEGAVSSTLSHAAVMFSRCALWRQGTTGADIAVPRDYIMAAEYAYLSACIGSLRLLRSSPLERTTIPGIDDIYVQPLPAAILSRCCTSPPASEWQANRGSC
jgi:hypothetical protein